MGPAGRRLRGTGRRGSVAGVFAMLAIAVAPALPSALGEGEPPTPPPAPGTHAAAVAAQLAPPAEVPPAETPPAEVPPPAEAPPPAETPPAEAPPQETPEQVPPAEVPPPEETPPAEETPPPAEETPPVEAPPSEEPVAEAPSEPVPAKRGLQSFGPAELGIPDPPAPTIAAAETEPPAIDGPVDASTELIAPAATDMARPLESQSQPRAVLGSPHFASLSVRERASAKAEALRDVRRRNAAVRVAGATDSASGPVAVAAPVAAEPTAPATPATTGGAVAPAADTGADAAERRTTDEPRSGIPLVPIVFNALSETVAFVPLGVWIALGAMLLLALMTLAFAVARDRYARRLARERVSLVADLRALEGAVLPELPEVLGGLALSVTSAPATGPAAGGDFHDAFPLSGDRVAVIVGDVAGQGGQVLADAQLVRHAVRAYLEAGLDPRSALAMTGAVVEEREERLFASVLVAVHDRRDGTLTFASAGHEPPILVTDQGAGLPPVPGWSPPLGTGLETGRRQTQVPLPDGSAICLITDGVTEARSDGERMGASQVIRWLQALGPGALATDIVGRLLDEADEPEDDITVCMLRALTAAAPDAPRIEEAIVEGGDPTYLVRFLRDCGLPLADAEEAGAALAAAPDGTRMVASVEIHGGRAVVELAPLRGSSTETLVR